MPDDLAAQAMRESFRAALVANDYAMLRRLAGELRDCNRSLPRSACLALGLPRGSTYALAAATIVAP